MKPTSVLKKIRIQSIRDHLKYRLEMLDSHRNETNFRRFAIMHGTGNEPSSMYWIPPETDPADLSPSGSSVLYKVFRILPYDGAYESDMTSTIVLGHLAPYCVQHGIPLRMIADYDFNYLLVPTSQASVIQDALELFFTVF